MNIKEESYLTHVQNVMAGDKNENYIEGAGRQTQEP